MPVSTLVLALLAGWSVQLLHTRIARFSRAASYTTTPLVHPFLTFNSTVPSFYQHLYHRHHIQYNTIQWIFLERHDVYARWVQRHLGRLHYVLRVKSCCKQCGFQSWFGHLPIFCSRLWLALLIINLICINFLTYFLTSGECYHCYVKLCCVSMFACNVCYSLGFQCCFVVYRILAQFAFSLSLDWELAKRRQRLVDDMKVTVRDMLVTHHLFSWEL